MTVKANRCSTCGSAVDDSIAGGECVCCLMQLGIDTSIQATTAHTRVPVRGAEEVDALPPEESVSSVTQPPEEYANFLADPQQPDEIGRLGAYRVLKVLGVGGMGIVYQAEDPTLKRPIALKVMKPSIAAKQTAKERFLREAQAAAGIDHDNIITIYQVGEEEGVPFIAMRFLHGESLESRLRREQRLEACEAARIGHEVANGLAAAHQQGLIHRDIKPDNIWLDANAGRAKILDFGLVRSHEADSGLTQTGVVVGTPRYMAPEQATGEKVDQRSDLFSLGSVLYHLLSGAAPFTGSNLTATLIKVAQADCQPIETVCPGLDPAFADLISGLLRKDPEARPQSAAQVSLALSQIEQTLRSEKQRQLDPTIDSDSGIHAVASALENEIQAEPLLRSAPTRVGLWGTVIGGALLLLSGLAIYRLQTDQGTLVVEVDEAARPEVEAKLRAGGIVVHDRESQVSWTILPNTTKTVPTGSYRVEPVPGLKFTNDQGLELNGSEFVLKRKSDVVLRVTLDSTRNEPTVVAPAIGEIASQEPKLFHYVPPGLKPGDFYHLVFVTSQSRDGHSAEIADYNQFVNVVADAASIGPESSDKSPVGLIGWSAIVSTPTTAARDNARAEGPVYNTRGDLVAASGDDLWSSNLQNPISFDERGQRLESFYATRPDLPDLVTVFTGSKRDGTPHPTQALGIKPANNAPLMYQYGNVDEMGGNWVCSAQHRGMFKRPMYALSQRLSVPFEEPYMSAWPHASDVRDAAKILLAGSQRISLRLLSGGRGIKVSTVDDLPKDPFSILGVDDGPEMSDRDSYRLAERLKTQRDVFFGTEVEGIDRKMRMMSLATSLQRIEIHAHGLTGAGLAHLAQARNLQVLTFKSEQVTDKDLQRFTRLRVLKIRNSRIDGSFLTQMPELRLLELVQASINDEGLANLQHAPKIEELNLDGCQNVTDASLEHIAGLPRLRKLLLQGTSVNGSGLEHLANHGALSTMVLTGTAVTDESILALGAIPSLRSITLHDTQVTAEGVAALRQALPKCHVACDSD